MLGCSVTALAQTVMPCRMIQPKRHNITIEVTGCDNTNSDHVSRVGCNIISVPHTSTRVDSVTAVIAGHCFKADDIDGIDFQRYFQWEDEPKVYVEVDLPYTRKFQATDSVYFHTVHGVFSASLLPAGKSK